MSKETMKLALDALDEFCELGAIIRPLEVRDALREALAKPDFWEGYVHEPVKPAQQALDKKAENARELGLDYEPAQQEPVAGCVCRWNSEGDRVVTCERHQGWLEVIAEWADRAREAEKKLKVLNTSPPAQRTWVGLSDLNIDELENNYVKSAQTAHEFLRAIEAKLKEKNT